ncbi:TetR/AcrR family transcriptional regulator [Luteibacter sp.]|jgi:AcrR family transcriptional regulator|uniref:TetR/AcrR family transcriptional regulator n=1 Tax=Luteibacter sp. TaxID=1886636 RepID=UPI002F402918
MTQTTNTPIPARQRILDTADRLFYSDGLRATGIDRIIAESGVAKMSFYRHFPAKRDLIVAFLENRRMEWIGWFRTEVEARLAKKGAGLEVIADVMDSWFAQSGFRGCTFANTVAERAHGEEPIARVVADHETDIANYVEELAGRLGLSRPRQVAEAVAVVMEGLVVRAQITGHYGDPAIGRMLLRGIAREFTRARPKS